MQGFAAVVATVTTGIRSSKAASVGAAPVEDWLTDMQIVSQLPPEPREGMIVELSRPLSGQPSWTKWRYRSDLCTWQPLAEWVKEMRRLQSFNARPCSVYELADAEKALNGR